jgi:hypothetical protein
VIVRENHRRRTENDRGLEDLAHRDQRSVERADCNWVDCQDAVLGVEQDSRHDFAVGLGDQLAQRRGDIGG